MIINALPIEINCLPESESQRAHSTIINALPIEINCLKESGSQRAHSMINDN